MGGIWGRLGANQGEGPDKGVPFQHGLSGLQRMAGMDRERAFPGTAGFRPSHGLHDDRAGLESWLGAVRKALLDVL